jgi:hypothetical protein
VTSAPARQSCAAAADPVDLLMFREAAAELAQAFSELGHAGQECADLEALASTTKVTAAALRILLAAVTTIQAELAASDEREHDGLTQLHIKRAELAARQARQMLRGAHLLLVRTGEQLSGIADRHA